MADVLRIKRRALGGAAGAPSSLAVGELAFNEVDGTLWIGRSNGSVVQINIPDVPNDNVHYARRNLAWTGIGSAFVRYDTTQGLTTPQQALGLQNIGAAQYHLINGKIVESHASNAATYAVKTLAGSDPSATDPVMVRMPDSTLVTITAALSITIPSGSKLADASGASASANTPFRLWFAIVVSGGTPYLGVFQSNSNNQYIKALDPRGVIATSQISGSTAACILYISANISGALYYRAVAFADYDSGLATPGAWAASPTRIMLVGPDSKLPGDLVQTVNFGTSAQTLIQATGGFSATAITALIALYSPINGILVDCRTDGLMTCSVSNEQSFCIMYRNDASQIGYQQGVIGWGVGVQMGGVQFAQTLLDFPLTIAFTRYRLFARLSINAGNSLYIPWVGSSLKLQEIMA